jgi:hypothetical protein
MQSSQQLRDLERRLKNRKKQQKIENRQTNRQLNKPAEIETNSPQSSASIFATGQETQAKCMQIN